MKLRLNTTIIISLLLACAMQIFAHGGFDHVTGTVVKLDNNVLTVKTAKGDVPVTLDAKTEITRGDKPAQAADLKAASAWWSIFPKAARPNSRIPSRSARRPKRQLRRPTRTHK